MLPHTSSTELADALDTAGYLADDGLALSAFLALKLKRPLFCEGEPGTGKTSLSKALAEALSLPLIRLQCYEGIDISQAPTTGTHSSVTPTKYVLIGMDRKDFRLRNVCGDGDMPPKVLGLVRNRQPALVLMAREHSRVSTRTAVARV